MIMCKYNNIYVNTYISIGIVILYVIRYSIEWGWGYVAVVCHSAIASHQIRGGRMGFGLGILKY
jgi:hypothetical protein